MLETPSQSNLTEDMCRALALGGCAWALVNINSLPMVVDTSDSDANIGTYTGFYYLASQLAAIAGPVLNGLVIEQAGNYGLVLLMLSIGVILQWQRSTEAALILLH